MDHAWAGGSEFGASVSESYSFIAALVHPWRENVSQVLVEGMDYVQSLSEYGANDKFVKGGLPNVNRDDNTPPVAQIPICVSLQFF